MSLPNNNSSFSSSIPSFTARIKSQPIPLVGMVLAIPSVTIAQLAAQTDADFIMIDMEHAPLPMDTVTQMVHAYVQASRGAKYALIRVPSHGVEWIKWALDSGASGIVVPMVNNAQEVKDILDWAVYPPRGRRSFGPLYAPFADPNGPGSTMADYIVRAQRGDVAVLPMIESKEGLDNVEAILRMEEVSGCFIGPADLRFSLGMAPALDGSEPAFLDALKAIVVAGRKFGKVVGTMGVGEEQARKRTAEGMDFILSTFDFGAVVTGMTHDLAVARRGVQQARSTKF